MTDEQKEKARKMIAEGMTVSAASKALGISPNKTRWHLNINNYRERNFHAGRKSRASVGTQFRNIVSRPNTVQLEEVEAVLLVRPITLPTFTLPPVYVDDTPPARTYAPRSTVVPENPRIERIRQIHRAMMRQGRVASKDVFSAINR